MLHPRECGYCERCGYRYETRDLPVKFEQTNLPISNRYFSDTANYFLCSFCTEDFEEWLDRGNPLFIEKRSTE